MTIQNFLAMRMTVGAFGEIKTIFNRFTPETLAQKCRKMYQKYLEKKKND